ncbi:MAG: response regulator [Nitrospinae bacterium]|nr:response regulator [Nitrospinota bacterium]MBI3812880.1 response regulator [Nitrospinota bacterium]
MKEKGKPIVILLAEDDEDDYILIRDALVESRVINDLHWVKDGEELMDYLLHRGQFEDANKSPMPGLVLLDLNMPKKDGREALEEIKANQRLRHIPVVVLTTSKAEEDILRSYDIGANSFVRKPVNFSQFVEMVRILGKYWFEIVELPVER